MDHATDDASHDNIRLQASLPNTQHELWPNHDGNDTLEADNTAFRTNDMMANLLQHSPSASISHATTPSPDMGASSSRLYNRHPKDQSFVPPTRPSSTPYLFPDGHGDAPPPPPLPPLSTPLRPDTEFVTFEPEPTSQVTSPACGTNTPERSSKFEQLPIEVHEAILDHLFGFCVSPTSRSGMGIYGLTRSWGTILRHSRRRIMTNLALVSRIWRILVQHRLYRHIKLKGSIGSVENAIAHFAFHQRLAGYVRHIEIWFPVFKPKAIPIAANHAVGNCSLEDVFQLLALVLPDVKVLTLEGGERRNAPQVAHFNPSNMVSTGPRALPRVFSVKTLITKGQWNLVRRSRDFATILSALPCLDEWQAGYSKPKAKSYITMAEYLPNLPNHVKSLSICLENDYKKESVLPSFYARIAERTHMCVVLGTVAPKLEQLAFTGRICHGFFETAIRMPNAPKSMLRSIDVTVKHCCCRQTYPYDFGSGIQEMAFIAAFERLVISGIRALGCFKHIEYLRIRFVDLDSILPPLNPYFLVENGQCSGVWSNTIISEMATARPSVQFTDLSETFGDISYSKEGRMVVTPEYPRTRITSLKLSNYQKFANRITIH
ncbi:hypothetical protein Golomagni_05378 [Golovinomyces magnicellulatus]|nr:hypothetical protein Golomagni_05378 [Golovinomyces magnicellulatus]